MEKNSSPWNNELYQMKWRGIVASVSVNAPTSVNDDNNGIYRSRYCKEDHIYTKRRQRTHQKTVTTVSVNIMIFYKRWLFSADIWAVTTKPNCDTGYWIKTSLTYFFKFQLFCLI